MGDFKVPVNPGWGARFLEKHGDAEDDVQIMSPAFRHATQKMQLKAQLLKAVSETVDEQAIKDSTRYEIASRQ